jgi:hypothetical protein
MAPVHLLLIAGSVLAALLVVWVLLAWLRPRPRPPYTKRQALLTAGELRFNRVLARAVPAGLAVFVKVRLMHVVSVPEADWAEWGARGSGMHLGFVLAQAATTEPRLVIELDDRSHARPKAKERDAYKDAALAAAGVPVLRVAVTGRYDVAELRERVKRAVEGSPTAARRLPH